MVSAVILTGLEGVHCALHKLIISSYMCRLWLNISIIGPILASHVSTSIYLHLTYNLYSSQVVANAMFTVKPHYVNVFTFSHDFVFCMTYQNCTATATTAQPASPSQSFIKLLLEATGQAFQTEIKRLSLVMMVWLSFMVMREFYVDVYIAHFILTPPQTPDLQKTLSETFSAEQSRPV